MYEERYQKRKRYCWNFCATFAKVVTAHTHTHTRVAVSETVPRTLIIGKTPRGYSNLKRNFTLSLHSREKNFQKHFAYGDDFTVLFQKLLRCVE